jgi:hypothetical protein
VLPPHTRVTRLPQAWCQFGPPARVARWFPFGSVCIYIKKEKKKEKTAIEKKEEKKRRGKKKCTTISVLKKGFSSMLLRGV